MPRRKRKGITPFDIFDAFARVMWDQPAKTVIKNIVFHGEPPVESEDISQEQTEEVLEDIFGEGFFEDEQFVSQEEREETNDDGVEFDGEFYRFDRKPRHRTPKTQRVASEYAEWFRIQGERARGEEHAESVADEGGMPVADACRVLGVAPDADLQTIKTAFRRLAKRWHPDVCPEGPERGEIEFKKISLAYESLCRSKDI